MIKKIIIPYFPTGLRYTTPVIFIVAIYLCVVGYFIWGTLLILICALIFTTKYITEINFEEKMYRDYLTLLGFKLNEDIRRFNHIDRIIITKGNYSQNINTRISSRQMNWSDYTGTIIHDGTGRLDLITNVDKDALVRELIAYADFLKIGIEDRTTSRPYWIDLNKGLKNLN